MYKSIIIIILLVLAFIYSSLFFVQEGQNGIILRFGKVVRSNDNNPLVYNPGMHWKIPFIEDVKVIDTRINTTENQADRFVTMEKKDLIIDSYIKWRVNNISRYYLSTGGNITQAEILIKRKFSDRLRSELGKLDVRSIVTDFRNKLMNDVKNSLNYGIITNNIYNLKNTKVNNSSMSMLGIEIIDVRIKQINLPIEVFDAIYKRMRAERESVARRHRSQGKEEAEKIRAIADYQVTRIISEAKKQSSIIRGDADAKIIKIYAQSFSKDPDFYDFIKRLKIYKNSFRNNRNTMILNSQDGFFKFINEFK
ncbi:MAG: protease modulator HflC [Candidatus Lightella neohaematopini]|nr:protease modulator HflC [Candidatus Lightella neohaematopini]MCV2528983.1 protease modulator HflC [Candidatus Lightella neohaematopini]